MRNNRFSKFKDGRTRTLQTGLPALLPDCVPNRPPRRESEVRARAAAGCLHGHGEINPGGETILVPVDFTDVSHQALDYALSLASSTKCSILLVHVLDRTYGEGFLESVPREKARTDTRRHARKRLAALARSKGIPEVAITSVVRAGIPEYEILRIAKVRNAKMIVMGRRNRSPLSRLIFGSVTRDVIDGALCPVLVVNSNAHGNITASEIRPEMLLKAE